MRSWLLMILLLLSILIHDAQGIRLIRKGSVLDRQHSIHEQLQGKRSNNEGSVEEAIMCKSKQCSGRIRKLTMIRISSTTTIAKNDKNEEIKADPKLEASPSTSQKIGRKEENLRVNSSSKTQQGQAGPDDVDIAEMDYSLARRKPPIHN